MNHRTLLALLLGGGLAACTGAPADDGERLAAACSAYGHQLTLAAQASDAGLIDDASWTRVMTADATLSPPCLDQSATLAGGTAATSQVIASLNAQVTALLLAQAAKGSK